MNIPSHGRQGDLIKPAMRDRISVDLRGLKAALTQRAQVLGVSPSDLVRVTLAGALGQGADARVGEGVSAAGLPAAGCAGPGAAATLRRAAAGTRVRLCVRMRREQALDAQAASLRERLSLGDYLAGLVAGVPVLTGGASLVDLIVELRASSAELATLARNIHRLTALLRQAEVEPAQAYRVMLDRVAGDVQAHLRLAAQALASLQPRGGVAPAEASVVTRKPALKPRPQRPAPRRPT